MSQIDDISKPMRFVWMKKLFHSIGLYSPYEGSNTTRPQYIFLRKCYRFLGLYPNVRWMHLYLETPTSMMAPKVYEYMHMLRMTKLRKEDTVLDLGCGEGTLTLGLAKSVRKAVGVDTNPITTADAQFKANELSNRLDAEFHCGKVEELGLADGSFNKVFSFSVIEHIPNYMEVFRELYRLLKPGGELIISVDSFSDFDPEMLKIHERDAWVQKYFMKDELRELLHDLGFEHIEIKPIFKSEFSKKWFARALTNPAENFDFHKRIYSWLLYYIIGHHERKVKQNEEGLFLLARAVK